MRMFPAVTACGASLLICGGLLTLFVAARWPASVLEAGLLIQAAALLVWGALRDVPLRRPAVLLPVACTACWSALQLVLGVTAAPWPTGEKTLEYVAVFAALALLAQVVSDPVWCKRLVDGLLVFGTLLAVVALLQLLTSQGKAFWLFETGYADEVLGPFVSRNTYAQFVEILFPLALYQAIRWRQRAPLMVMVAGILFASEVAGGSRVGTIVLVAEMPMVLLFSHLRGMLSGRTAALFALAFAVAVAVWSFLAGWDYVFSRFGEDPWADQRWPVMMSSFRMLQDHLWRGVGYGAWPSIYPQYATFDVGAFVNQAHCDWLQIACEGGLLGLGLFLWSIASLLKGLLRSVWGLGFLGVLCHAAFDFPFQHGPAFTVFLFSAALLAAESAAHSHRRRHRSRHHSGATPQSPSAVSNEA